MGPPPCGISSGGSLVMERGHDPRPYPGDAPGVCPAKYRRRLHPPAAGTGYGISLGGVVFLMGASARGMQAPRHRVPHLRRKLVPVWVRRRACGVGGSAGGELPPGRAQATAGCREQCFQRLPHGSPCLRQQRGSRLARRGSCARAGSGRISARSLARRVSDGRRLPRGGDRALSRVHPCGLCGEVFRGIWNGDPLRVHRRAGDGNISQRVPPVEGIPRRSPGGARLCARIPHRGTVRFPPGLGRCPARLFFDAQPAFHNKLCPPMP